MYAVKKAMCYGFCPKLSHAERLALAKEAGLDGVEIFQYETQAETEEIAGAIRDAGLEVASLMAGTHWQFPLSSTDEDVREKGVEGVKQACQMAAWAGTDVVLVVPAVVTEDVHYAAAYELSRKSIKEILPTAEKLGITIALENVWNKFLLSPLEFRDYLDDFGHPLIKAYFDVGNILLYGYPHQWIETLGERIVRIHIKDFDVNSRQFVGLLQGSVDYPRTINALRGVGYDGWLTAELGPYRQYPERFVFDTAAQLEEIIRGL
jgi:L-ribulose-5-phosphate 3-epimerase